MTSKLSEAPVAYTFDDFTLNPVHSTLRSRKEPDTKTKIGDITYTVPIIASPMNTVTEQSMILCLRELGGCSVLHRYMSIGEQLDICTSLYGGTYFPHYVAVGATGDYLERVDALLDIGVKHFCVDVANGHSQMCIDAVLEIAKKGSSIQIMAGDVCNMDGAYRLADAGCTSIRIGIGPGSMCTTRIVTGHGVPQLTAIEDCARIKAHYPDVCLIADGGIRSSGDIVKAIAIGADAVMLGNLLAGTEESPGQTFKNENGTLSKSYAGMASEQGRAEWFDKSSTSYVPEGVSTTIPFKGSAKKVVENLVGGLRVGMSYCDAHNLQELRDNAQWVRVTNAGHREGTPHGKK